MVRRQDALRWASRACMVMALGIGIGGTVTGPANAAETCPHEGTPGPGIVIEGTPGPDRLCGTTGDDVIYGGGGDDHIIGGTGNDIIYGDDGNDTIIAGAGNDTVYGGARGDTIIGDYPQHYYDWYDVERPAPEDAADHIFGGSGGDRIRGEEGDDVIDVGDSLNDEMWISELANGGTGNDVLIGTGPTYSSSFHGDEGNDILYPYPFRTAANTANGGAGSDVAILVNMTRYTFPDQANLNGTNEIPIGSSCVVVDPLTGNEDTGSVTCTLPWPRSLSGLDEILDVKVSVDENGKITWSGELYDGLAGLQVDSWRALAQGGGVTADICLCDPLVQLGTIPPSGHIPFDYTV